MMQILVNGLPIGGLGYNFVCSENPIMIGEETQEVDLAGNAQNYLQSRNAG